MKLFAVAATATAFDLDYTWGKTECYFQVTSEQTIASPGFPNFYDDNVACEWEIDVGDVQGVMITKNVFDVEYESQCQFDSLLIATPEDFTSEGKLVGGDIFCGQKEERKRRETGAVEGTNFKIHTDGFPSDFFIPGGKAAIGFQTNYDIVKQGFKFDLEIVPKPEPKIVCPNEYWSPNASDSACVPVDLTVDCLSTVVTITAHVNHLYANLPESHWPEVRLNIGSCEGTKAPSELGWMTETFDLGKCGGVMTQAAEIAVNWQGAGPASLIEEDGIYITSPLSFNAECVYRSEVMVFADAIEVGQILNEVEKVVDVSNFQQHFKLIISSEPEGPEAVDVNIGETLHGRIIVTDLDLSPYGFEYQALGCIAHDSADYKGHSYDILPDYCNPSEAIAFDPIDLDGHSDDAIDFKFTSFTFDTNDDELHLTCEVKICVKDPSGNFLNPNCFRGPCSDDDKPVEDKPVVDEQSTTIMMTTTVDDEQSTTNMMTTTVVDEQSTTNMMTTTVVDEQSTTILMTTTN